MKAQLTPPAPSNVTLAARAKINLVLDVRRRRPDGYHEVCTLMHTVSLHDTVVVELSGKGGSGVIEVTCRPDEHLSGPANLAHRAAKAYLAAAAALTGPDDVAVPAPARPVGVRVAIEKRIPIAAGLAGGSADAAATLRGLAQAAARLRRQSAVLSGLPLPALGPIAAALGTDVPFCLSGGAAWGVGRGDELTRVPSLLHGPVVIVAPPFAVASRDAYAWWDEDNAERDHPARPQGLPGRTPELRRLDTLRQVSALVRNDLRPSVARRHPLVAEILSAVRSSGAEAAEMSGSGPAVFGIFDCVGEASEASRKLVAAFPGARVVLCALDPAAEPPAGTWLEEPSGGGTN